MPSQHKTPLLGWHPPAGLSAWVRAEAARRHITVSELLNEIITAAMPPSERDDSGKPVDSSG